MDKTFLVGVGNVIGMIGNEIVFTAKTLKSTSITTSATAEEIRGGQGNQLQKVYYHSGTFAMDIVDTQFRPEFIALNTGTTIVNGGKLWENETVTLNGTNGTITGTAIPLDGQTSASVWVEYKGEHYSFTLTDKTFNVESSNIPENSTLCVAYRIEEDSAKTITIPADFKPGSISLYITAPLYGDNTSSSGTNGRVEIYVPVGQLAGNMEISMNADGYSQTPLSIMALAHSDSDFVGCNNDAYYAKITTIKDNENWYDNVIGLAVVGGDFSMVEGDTKTLQVYAVQ